MKNYLFVLLPLTVALFAQTFSSAQNPARDAAVVAAPAGAVICREPIKTAVTMKGGKAAAHKFPDAAYISDIKLDNSKTLHLFARFGGGCEAHDFQLFAQATDDANVLDLYLSHDAHDDRCEAMLSRELYFDLSPIIDQYLQTFSHNRLTLRIFAPGDDTPLEQTVELKF